MTQADSSPPSSPVRRFDKLLALANTRVGGGIAAALLLVAAAWSWTLLDQHLHGAERAAAMARAQAQVDAQNLSPLLPILAREDSPERALACRVLFYLITSQAIGETLGLGLAHETGRCLSAKQFDGDGTRGSALIDGRALMRLDRRGANLKPLSKAETALAETLPRRLYIQYASPAQQEALLALRGEYERRGWIVPAAENVGAKAPAQLQVHFFHEADRQAADNTVLLLRGLPPYNLMPQAKEATLLKRPVPPGQIEVWLPA